ncbi:MAG TPA: beta-galactosidase [Devosia sp.]|nr:beta-galactosidase [Devosia sp.]
MPRLGVCYYPEHWPEGMWETDAAQMVASGIKVVRIGEFAWGKIEPEPGHFCWEWLDGAIGVLGDAGLEVVMSTPTATPPRWMLDKWPDMLGVDRQGRTRKFGSRRHYCFSHEGYRGECARIAKILGARYGQNPHIKAWQIDNEYGCHDTTLSYSPAARGRFIHWLKQKYQTIDELNRRWGNVFWSMQYNRFEQIDLPNLSVTEPNPAHVMDFTRFSSHQVVAFNRVQVDVLRALTDKPLIHNYMGRILDFDHFAVAGDLDIAAWDSYPLGFLEDRSERDEKFKHEFMRQGDPDFQAFHHDLYRAVGRGNMWVMEQQPGPVNWAPFNPAPLPGMARLWALESFAHGAEIVSYFRWRQVSFGQEQMHAGLLNPDNSPAPVLGEVKQVFADLTQFECIQSPQATIAIVFDYQSAWCWQTQPQGADFDYFALVFDFYSALRSLGLTIDFIPPDCADLSRYKLVVMPGLFAISDELRAAMKQFRGAVLSGPRTGAKTPDMQIPVSLPPDISGLDFTVQSVESLRPDEKIPLEGGGNFIRWVENIVGEAPVLLSQKNKKPALLGHSSNAYLSGWPDEAGMLNVLKFICRANHIETVNMPRGVRRIKTQTHGFVFNYNCRPVSFEGTRIEAAGLHIYPIR